MTTKNVLVVFLFIAVASASGCCRGFKILQFRRPAILPVYEAPPPCDHVYDDQEPYCDALYQQEAVAKYEHHHNRYYPPYMEPKPIPHKCPCKSQRMMNRCYKRNYYADPMMEEMALRPGHSCGQCPCGQYGDYNQYNQCGHCGIPPPPPPPIFRQPSHRVLPLTFPASCVC